MAKRATKGRGGLPEASFTSSCSLYQSSLPRWAGGGRPLTAHPPHTTLHDSVTTWSRSDLFPLPETLKGSPAPQKQALQLLLGRPGWLLCDPLPLPSSKSPQPHSSAFLKPGSSLDACAKARAWTSLFSPLAPGFLKYLKSIQRNKVQVINAFQRRGQLLPCLTSYPYPKALPLQLG